MGKETSSKVQFVRIYPFYLKLGANQAFSFSVTIAAQKQINPLTGMSVDLVKFDKIAARLLKTKKAPESADVVSVLRSLVRDLKKYLALEKSKLMRVQFSECRGSSYLFTDGQVIFIRQDFATDDKGDLFKVASYFNSKNNLIRLDLKNLKLGLTEQIIF